MHTLFDLVGFFKKQVKTGTGVQSYNSVIMLKKNMTLEEVEKIGYGNLESLADSEALQYTRHTPYERVWMQDWELQSHAEQAARKVG
jgi:hypothetical protein